MSAPARSSITVMPQWSPAMQQSIVLTVSFVPQVAEYEYTSVSYLVPRLNVWSLLTSGPTCDTLADEAGVLLPPPPAVVSDVPRMIAAVAATTPTRTRLRRFFIPLSFPALSMGALPLDAREAGPG